MMDILAYLRKGALLAQNPGGVEDIAELDDSDREVIRREKTRMRAYLFRKKRTDYNYDAS